MHLFFLLGFIFFSGGLHSEDGLLPIFKEEAGSYLEFRTELENDIQTIEKQFIKSRNLKFKEISIQKRSGISHEECLTLAKSIEASYSHSPFDFIGNGFSSHFSLCHIDADDTPEKQRHNGMQYYFAPTHEKTAMGLEASKGLIVERPLNNVLDQPTRELYLLDSNNRIIEIRSESFDSERKTSFEKVMSQTIETLDTDGNFYFKSMQNGGKMPVNIYKYTSFDGVVNNATKMERYVVDEKGNAKSRAESNYYSVSSNQDWKNVFMPLTLAWLGARFEYDSGFYTTSKYRDFLRTIKIDGHEICAEGDRRFFDKWFYYTQEGRSRNDCWNQW